MHPFNRGLRVGELDASLPIPREREVAARQTAIEGKARSPRFLSEAEVTGWSV